MPTMLRSIVARRGEVLIVAMNDESSLRIADGQGVQAAERGVAGAEVVDGDAEAQGPQLVQRGDRGRGLRLHQALGHLEHGLLAGQPVSASAARIRAG